jgi:small subunit ribosomal protein S1
MIHVSEITQEKRIHHPQDALKLGQQVRAQVLEVDPVKRQLRLSIKKLIPVSLDEYMAEHHQGDLVTGRLIDVAEDAARVELGQGIEGICRLTAQPAAAGKAQASDKADLSSLSSMLQARWKGGISSASKPEAARAGQIRSFRIVSLDSGAKKIQLELA